MITLLVKDCNTLSQDFYNSCIFNLQLHRIRCSCGHSGCLTFHGYYTRKVKAPGGSFRLKVCRVICSECGRTHAILPSSLVPYSQIPLDCQCQIVCFSESGSSPDPILEKYPDVDENNVKHVIRNYRRHWKERLLSEDLGLSPLITLVMACFAHYSAQFMQIRRMANILFQKPT